MIGINWILILVITSIVLIAVNFFQILIAAGKKRKAVKQIKEIEGKIYHLKKDLEKQRDDLRNKIQQKVDSVRSKKK